MKKELSIPESQLTTTELAHTQTYTVAPLAIRHTTKRPVRILYVGHTANIGGGEIAIFNLTAALDKTRFTPVFVLASDGALANRLRASGIETHVLPLAKLVNETRKDSLGWKSLLDIKAVFLSAAYTIRLARFMRKLDVSLVHTNSLKAHIYGGISGRMAGLKVLWHIRDNIDETYLPPIVASCVRWLAKIIPVCIVANSNSTLKKMGVNPSKLTAVVYSGSDIKRLAATEVIHDGMNLDEFSGSEYVLATSTIRPLMIAMVGRITQWKGQHVYIRAAAKIIKSFPNARFQIIGAPMFGEHEYDRSLRELVDELGMQEHIDFLGFREDIPDLLSKCDLFVHASIIGEPFGQVVVEAMLMGKPVIATNGGGLREIVVHNKTGLLVEMNNVDAMADAMKVLLSNRVMAQELGAAARHHAIEHFSVDNAAAKVTALYERLTGPF